MHLPSIAHNGKYVLLSLDLALEWGELLDLEWGVGPGTRVMTSLSEIAVLSLSSELSGVEVGPYLGFSGLIHKNNQAGCLISLDKRLTQADPLSLPGFYPNWGVEHIKNNYGLVSLRLAYHPGEKLALDKQKLLAEIADHCRYEGVDLLLELIITPSTDDKRGSSLWQEAQLIAVSELCSHPDILALEYPGGALASATVTARLDLPWILLDTGLKYATYKEQVRECLESGAAGILMAGSVWQDLPAVDQPDDFNNVQKFIDHEVRDRVIELSRIVQETQV